MIDPDNHVVRLCIDGACAEFEGRLDDAHAHYQQAWDAAQDDYEACTTPTTMGQAHKNAEAAPYEKQQ